MGEEMADSILRTTCDFHGNCTDFYMPQSYDMGQMALLPLRRKAHCGRHAVKGMLWMACCGRHAVDGMLWKACCGWHAVDGMLWKTCCGWHAVEVDGMLWKACCGWHAVDGMLWKASVDGMLWIFMSTEKILRLQPGLNPRTRVLEASMLLDH
jgi:hypothetical protein